MKEHQCPVCHVQVTRYQRYPRYLCRRCASNPTTLDGQPIEFFNTDISGGFTGRLVETGEPFAGHDCLVSGVKCWADEARFGGIVIQAVPKLYWQGAEVANFEALIAAVPDDALRSPFRSTVPLLAFFREPHIGLTMLEHCLAIQIDGIPDLVFESPLRPPQGQGKPSYTDLVIRGSAVALGIEAKSTEPRYETTEAWLGPDPTPNRRSVLRGWLSIIEEATGVSIPSEAILHLPYQLIHRTASVCAEETGDRMLVYWVFGPAPEASYVEDVRSLTQVIGRQDRLSVSVVHISFEGTSRYGALADRWRAGDRDLGREIRAGLLEGQLFDFHYPRVLWADRMAV